MQTLLLFLLYYRDAEATSVVYKHQTKLVRQLWQHVMNSLYSTEHHQHTCSLVSNTIQCSTFIAISTTCIVTQCQNTTQHLTQIPHCTTNNHGVRSNQYHHPNYHTALRCHNDRTAPYAFLTITPLCNGTAHTMKRS